MTDITNTGERILLEKETPLMIARHLCAYRFSKDYVINKQALDIGCGEGYGTYYLSEFSKEIVGIDYDKAIIDYAKSKYQRNNLKFLLIDIKNLDSINDKFDVICSFQFIEHIKDTDFLLLDTLKLLKDNGIFICSTPNKKDASPNSNTPLNKFHIQEYLLNEFKELLTKYFKEINIFGLKRGRRLNFYRRLKKIGLFNPLPAFMNPVKRFYDQINCDNFIIVENKLDTALDFIAVCRK